ncbi:Ulp1 protease family [Loa loa]|uniref:Ulp1 protease family n=1 Tax=Loa loa TaxID=7209 RepID=A0A1S0UHK8_LOALO|nr:Ulp1 protease family [Loa loa]EJD74294.1 Ulp1 protease family [Loa loa]
MGNQPYRYSVYGNKRRRLEPIRQQMISNITPASNDGDNGSIGIFGFITRFLAPVTNLFRPSVKSLTTEETCSSNSDSTFSGRLSKRPTNGDAQQISGKGTSESMTGENDDPVIIEQEDSVLYSLISKKASSKDIFRENNVKDDSLRYDSPSPQPEHSISQQISPSHSQAGSHVLSDKWERRRTLSSAKNTLLSSRYSPYKIFLSENLDTSRKGRFGRQASVIDKVGKERYRKFLEEAGILKADVTLSHHNERKRLPKRTNYLELLQRGQSALNSVSKGASPSASLSRNGSTTTNSSGNIAVAEKSSSDSESSEYSNCDMQERKHSTSREVCVIWDTKHRDDFKALWEKEKNTKLLAEHRLAMHHQQAALRDRRAKELQIQKRLM